MRLIKEVKNTVSAVEKAIITDKTHGLSDVEIGKKYGITYRRLEGIIRKATGISISNLGYVKKVKTLFPKDFKEETTTVWSFKSRGNWATHSGEYRGNWSPYIPRNVIFKYSKPGELVLDYFCGAGTTAVEAKLLGRRCIALDINDNAVALAKRNVDFEIPSQGCLFGKTYEPELFVGDAKDLSFLKTNSVDLICVHPPYADIIHYTENKVGDLSLLGKEDFLGEMTKVARESYRVLRPEKICAILVGDMRKHKHVIPLGFELINIYLNAGFRLKELIIKRQHNCKTTGFWYTNSIKYNFLLLGHEYLPIFEKPKEKTIEVKEEFAGYGLFKSHSERALFKKKLGELETTTVWIFPENNSERLLNKNIIERYAEKGGYRLVDIGLDSPNALPAISQRIKNLLFIKSSCLDNKEHTNQDVALYIETLKSILQKELPYINKDGHYVVQTKDLRIGKYIEPLAKRIVDSICFPDFSLKEIVVITTEGTKNKQGKESENLQIAHQYLLVYKRNK